MIVRPAHSRRRHASITTRRVALAAIATVAAVTLTPATSHADTSSTITVVGTSDVFDSDLIQNVIKPDFEAANPQYTLNYVSLGTGAAITYAESGTASALLVHAASLENQFVAPLTGTTFSDEQFGRAIFYGDYVLLGPASDPAGVMSGTSPSHDIVTAFQKIATAGAGGTADFVSRANTSGTSVEEHAIWALTSGVPNLCDIAAGPNGGGKVPSTATGPCSGGTVGTIPAPAWYHQTGLTQGPNVVAADACDFGHGNDCYTLTDRATFQFLQSEGALSNLQVVTNHNAASAVGGANLLVNSFHAYAVNPAAFTSPNVHINLPGAIAFLNWLTSPGGQAEIGAYQANDPGGASFIPDAAPAITASKLPTTVKSGAKLTVKGTLRNVVPGTPPLIAVPITLTAKTVSGSSVVATGHTTATGAYTLTYTPKVNASYTVSSAPLAQIEIPTPVLTPQYGDLLQAASKSLGKTKVAGAVVIKKITADKGVVRISGTLAPAVSGSGAVLSIHAAHSGQALKFVSERRLKNGAKTFTVTVKLARGFTWRVSVKYVNAGRIVAGSSAARSVHVA
jgi:tungstate transport system substrate-binding protein